jgi:hypothetical protein
MKKIVLLMWVTFLFGCVSSPEREAGLDSFSEENRGSYTDNPLDYIDLYGNGRPFEEVGIGFNGPMESEYLLFRSKEDLLRYIPEEDLFYDIDFTCEMVLACFMGEEPTGGYMNRIAAIDESSDHLTVYVEISEPLHGDIVAHMVTSPWHAVVTELSDKTIGWSEFKAVR